MSKHRILLVEADKDTREMLKLALQVDGYDVVTAQNALRLVSMLQCDQPDAIVLDTTVQWGDGIELRRAIKANDTFHDIPLVFLANRDAAEEQRCKDSGAEDWFVKPIDVDRLLRRVSELVATRPEHPVPQVGRVSAHP